MKLTAIKFILLFLAQVAVWNYFNFTPYLFVVFLITYVTMPKFSHSSNSSG